VRRASVSHLDPNEVSAALSEIGVSEKSTFLASEGRKKMIEIDDIVVGKNIKDYNPDKRIKGDKSLQDVDDFLRALMN